MLFLFDTTLIWCYEGLHSGTNIDYPNTQGAVLWPLELKSNNGGN